MGEGERRCASHQQALPSCDALGGITNRSCCTLHRSACNRVPEMVPGEGRGQGGQRDLRGETGSTGQAEVTGRSRGGHYMGTGADAAPRGGGRDAKCLGNNCDFLREK